MLSNISIKRPVATAMLILMVVVVGIAALIGIPQDLLPKIEYPVALVTASYPNASPEEVETMVTKPLEQTLASVENLDQLQSITMQGRSIIVIQFQMETDMNFATLNMREKIAQVSGYLPDDVSDPMVMKLDMGALPIMQVYVSGDIPLHELNNEIDNNILTYFERSKGVASVQMNGGVTQEISVNVNPEKLSGYGLTLSALSQILAAENINLPSGNVSKGSTEVIVRTIGEFQSIDDIKNLPVRLADRSIVHMSDIAAITQGYKEQRTMTRIDGSTAIGIMVTKQSDANTVQVSNDLLKVVDTMREKYPELSFTVGFNQADFIKRSISSVSNAAILGAILAILVVFLFLRNLRMTLVIAISIPVSLLATFALMYARGITLNLITLCALTVVVGMLIDDSVIVLENIFRTRQFVDTAEEAARQGSSEIFLAIVAATLTKILVFLPIALSGGLASLMFKDFCFTIVIALLASLVVAITAVPMLSSKLLTRGVSLDYIRFGNRRYRFKLLPKFAQMIEWLKNVYGSAIRKSLMMRKRIIISCILLFVISLGLIGIVGTELMPASDEGSFTVSVEMPYGSPLAKQDQYMTEIETYLLGIPELKHCTLNIGSGGGMFSFRSGNTSSFSVTLTAQSDRKRSTAEVISEVKAFTGQMTGANITTEESSTMSLSMGGADMALLIKGSDLDTLEAIGNDLANQVKTLPEVVTASLDITEGNPEILVTLDRNTAAYYGITAYQLANGLSSSLSGTTATKLKLSGNEIDVRLSLPDSYSESVDNMKQIMITGQAGMQVPVGQIANFEYDNSPNVINRINQMRYVTLNVDIESKDLAGVASQITNLVDSYTLPDGYYYETAGSQQEMIEAFESLFLALIVSIALVYLLLAAQFESLIQPFIVVTAIPFAMSGAFVALFITGTALSMTSFLGLILLVGIVVTNSILLVEFITRNKQIMGRDEALVQAGMTRLRPILMTTLATIFGMVPISMGSEEGIEMLAPMGISIIGGLIASTLITLIFVPVLYAVIDDNKIKRTQKKQQKYERIAVLEEKWREEDTQNVRA